MIAENSEKAVCFLWRENEKAKVMLAKGEKSTYDLQPLKRLLIDAFHFKGGGSLSFMEFGGTYTEQLETALQEMVQKCE